MTTFTPEEVEMLKSRGNDYCRRVWLGLCDNSIQYKDEQQIKDFMIDKYEKKRYYIDPSTIPNLKPSTAQSTSQPPVTSTTQQSSQVVHPKSIPLRTTQITLTNGSAHPSSTSSTSSSTSTLPPPSSQSSLFQADFKLAPKDPFASSNGTSVPRNSRGQQSQPQPAAQQQPSFANFDNAVFSSVQQGIATVPEPNKKPMTAPLEIPKEDKYAALKDLDSIMKQQQLGSTPTPLDNQNMNGGKMRSVYLQTPRGIYDYGDYCKVKSCRLNTCQVK
ncbi:arf-GAP domain and FG repeat-containing protein 1 isoform X2 [Diaphorina citri]|uniref:Arf-GAP domain and FG repeat-containing protein 1 isoform X2 n=1 Tax=Diaphorina citri TaxID=121845 RepID=A0A3Q0J0G5_DIACI|nr:arf-GAP domain and FG repeat-containing protein 1 isoform X2 [Diaphorina citri]